MKILLFAGLLLAPAIADAQSPITPLERHPSPIAGSARLTGTVTAIAAALVTVTLRDGTAVQVDLAPAMRADRAAPVYPGADIEVDGARNGAAMTAQIVRRAKHNPRSWQPDTP